MAGEEASVSYYPILFIIGFFYGWCCGTSRGVWNIWEFLSCDNICMIDGIESRNKCCGIIVIILAILFPLTPGWYFGAYCKLYMCTCCTDPKTLQVKIAAYKASRVAIQMLLYGEVAKQKLGELGEAGAKYIDKQQQQPGQNA